MKGRYPLILGLAAALAVATYHTGRVETLEQRIVESKEREKALATENKEFYHALSARMGLAMKEYQTAYSSLGNLLGETDETIKAGLPEVKDRLEKAIDGFGGGSLYPVLKEMVSDVQDNEAMEACQEHLAASLMIGSHGPDHQAFKYNFFLTYSYKMKDFKTISGLHNWIRGHFTEKEYGEAVCEEDECYLTILYDERELVDTYLKRVEATLSYNNDLQHRLERAARKPDGKADGTAERSN